MDSLSMFEWGLALFAAMLIGVSKSGVKGLTPFHVLLLAQVFGAKNSTGIIVPLFLLGDIFAVNYYNRHAQWKYLRQLIPWMVVGVLVGVFIGDSLPESIFKQVMAVIVLVTVVMMFYWDKRKSPVVPDNRWFAPLIGMTAGITTMIGNLAGNFTTIFFLAMRLPKDQFIGTAAWLYFIINIFKIPFHIFYWETINLESLKINLYLLPATIIGVFLGIALLKKIKDQQYRKFIIFVTGLGAMYILIKSFFGV